MIVELPYGRGLSAVDLPDDRTDVVLPMPAAPAPDPAALLRRTLRAAPELARLRAMTRSGRSVVVSVCDHTRPQPRALMLEALLDVLGPADDDVTVLVATGTHRGSTDAELDEMLGPELRRRLRVVNHDCEQNHVALGMVRGLPGGDVDVAVDRRWVEADIRITTGFVEPHFFAGFSGGPKLVTPGLAALHTVQALHNVERIAAPRSIWGVVEDNPVHIGIRAAAALAPPDLAFDVLLDREHRITHAFAGALDEMHAAACATAREVAMRAVPARYPVVVTTNAGHPLDQNLYQAVKGMRSAAQIVAEGGLIVCAAECADGIPDGSPFAEQILRGRSPRRILADLAAAPEPIPEQWQIQVLAQLLSHARIGLHCSGIDDDTVRAAGLVPVPDIAAAVRDALAADGPDARVCVLPSGAETIPFVGA